MPGPPPSAPSRESRWVTTDSSKNADTSANKRIGYACGHEVSAKSPLWSARLRRADAQSSPPAGVPGGDRKPPGTRERVTFRKRRGYPEAAGSAPRPRHVSARKEASSARLISRKSRREPALSATLLRASAPSPSGDYPMRQSFSLGADRCTLVSDPGLTAEIQSHTGDERATAGILRSLGRFGSDPSIQRFEMMPDHHERRSRLAGFESWIVRAIRGSQPA